MKHTSITTAVRFSLAIFIASVAVSTANAQGGAADLHKEIEQATTQARGLRFKVPPIYKDISRAEFVAWTRREIREQYSEAKIVDISRANVLLGLLPEGTNIEEALLKLIGSQVAAFYDHKTSAVYEFKGAPQAPRQLWPLLCHELTHALQDQNFRLGKYPEMTIKDNDDRQRAFQGLFEGDACVTPQIAAKNGAPIGPASFPSFGSGPGAYLQNILVFPYVFGTRFCDALYARTKNFELIDKAYKDLPKSTEQILHPEKYYDPAKRDDPQEITLPELESRNWRLLESNVFGEFTVRQLLLMHLTTADPSAINAAAGWDGDRFHVYGYTGGGAALHTEPMGAWWFSVWDSPADAAEFDNALRACFKRRYLDIAVKEENKSTGVITLETPKWRIQIMRNGDKVTVLQTSPALFNEFSGLVEKTSK